MSLQAILNEETIRMLPQSHMRISSLKAWEHDQVKNILLRKILDSRMSLADMSEKQTERFDSKMLGVIENFVGPRFGF